VQVKNPVILLDADILAYELAFSGQFFDEEKKEKVLLPFYIVIERLEGRVKDLMDTLETLIEPIMFLSGDTNFRKQIAKRKGYKENRDETNKPFHLENTRAYITARFNTYTSHGCEADDLLCIAQMEALRACGGVRDKANTIIVTRDKDLRQCEGWHYGWECGKQPEYHLRWVDRLGELTPTYSKKVLKSGKPSTAIDKLIGTGMKWFYSQLLIGDSTDNIPGLKGYGNRAALDLIDGLEDEMDMLDVCVEAYKSLYGEDWLAELTEQAHLVWMIRERDDNGGLVWWSLPTGYRT